MKRFAIAALPLAGLAGCIDATTAPRPTLEAAAPAAIGRPGPAEARGRPVALDNALAQLPAEAGRPAEALRRRHPNGYSETLIVKTYVAAPPSRVEVAIQTGAPLSSPARAPVWLPGEAGIRDELRREFPDMPMRVVADGGFVNAYGRFGLAIGRGADETRCIYAWQYVDDARKSFGNGARLPLEGVGAAPAALRLKLCRKDMSIDALAELAKRLVIVIPDDLALAPAAAPRPAPEHPAPAPARRVAAKAEAARDRFPASPDGRRYLAPVEEAQLAKPTLTRPTYGANTASLRPAADLPPQAFVGPGAGGF